MRFTGAVALGCGLVAATLSACGEPGERIVVEVNGRGATMREFDALAARLQEEYQGSERDRTAFRKQVLDVVVARQLLLLEGEARGLDQDAEVQAELERYERELLIQAMYDRQIYRGIEPAREEIEALYRERGAGERVRASHILCATREEAEKVLEELGQGTAFEELASKVSIHRMSAPVGGDMGYMRKEELLPQLREAVWNARPGELLPQPFKTRLGYHVVKVVDHTTRSLAELEKRLVGEITHSKRDSSKRAFAAALRARYRFRWHGAVAQGLVADEISASQTPERLIAEWSGGGMTVEDYIQRIQRYSVRRTLEDTAVARQRGEEVVFDDLLVAEARGQNYDKIPSIVDALEGKKVALLAERLFEIEVGSQATVSRDSLKRFFQQHRQNYRLYPEIYIQEILVDDQALADSLRHLLLGGADMDSLARQYTQRRWARAKGGHFGPLTGSSLGYRPILSKALRAEIGVLQGPLQASGGYSLFRVTKREEVGESRFKEAEERVRQDLRERSMDRFIQVLKQRYAARIHIDQEVLAATLGGMDE